MSCVQFLRRTNIYMKQISIILTIFILNGCCSTVNKPTQMILLFKDKDGIYLYDHTKEKEKIVFRANNNQVFLDEPYKLTSDTLTFGIKGDLISTDKMNYSKGEKYFKNYYSIDLKSGKNWLSGKIIYEVVEHTLKITSQKINSAGIVTMQSDTTTDYKGANTTSKGITYNDFKPRFYYSSTVAGKTVYSYQGSIYLVDKSDTIKIVNYSGNFDPKFGSGYYQPELSPTAKFAVFRYLPGFLNFKECDLLQKIDINTKIVSTLKKGKFCNFSFSSDGEFILFERNGRFNKMDCWVSDIYVLDLTTLKEHKIGVASSASWKK